MNRWRVGEDMGSKETDGCPLTVRGEFSCKTMSSGWHGRWCGHSNR
jgi:hypothetical protein